MNCDCRMHPSLRLTTNPRLRFRQLRVNSLFAVVLWVSVFLSADSFGSAALCQNLFAGNPSLMEVEKRVGKPLTITSKDTSPATAAPIKTFKLALKPAAEGSSSLGVMIFRYDTNAEILHVDNITVYSEYKRKGVSLALLAEAIRLNPKTQIITSSLATENQEIAIAGLERGLTPLAAIQETPAFKIRKALGFSEVVTIEDSDSFSVRRPGISSLSSLRGR